MNTAGYKYLISDSTFSNNTTGGPGGAIVLYSKNDTTFTIRNSTFSGNKTQAGIRAGGAIYFSYSSVKHNDVLNIIADEGKNTEFINNISETDQGDVGSDLLVSGVTVNLNAGDGSKVVFDGSVASRVYDKLNINMPNVTYQYEFKADVSSEKEGFTKTAPTTGEVVFKSNVDYMDIHTYGGFIALLPGANTEKDSNDSSYYYVDHLAKSSLTIEKATTLKTQDLTPVIYQNLATYSADSEPQMAAVDSEQMTQLQTIAQSVKLQRVLLGNKLTLKETLYLQPAVDLQDNVSVDGKYYGKSDLYVVNADPDIQNNAKLSVNGWLIKADDVDESVTNVYVTLTESDNQLYQEGLFTLDDQAKVAYGPVYLWEVEKTDVAAEYLFKRIAEVPTSTNESDGGDGTDGGEGTGNSGKTGSSTGTESSSTDTTTGNNEGVTNEVEVVKTDTTPTPSSTPFAYNPGIYGQQVGALGVSVIQHAISETVFSEMGIPAYSEDDSPDRKPWWSKVKAGDLNLKTKNFYGIEMDYAIAMIGHQFDPIQAGAGKIEFGAYLGAATGIEKYSINKVRQNGGFIGGSVLYRNGPAWLGAHANFGIMSNRLKGVSDNTVTSPWFGLGASVGYSFEIPSIRMAVTPMFDVSYVNIQAKDYTTGQKARVHNSNLNSYEFAPGFRVDKRFDQGWSLYGQGRYAFVSKSSGKTTASHSQAATIALHSIANKNYVEYGLGIQKKAKNFGMALNVNRNDGGRQGWVGAIRMSYQF